MTKLSDSEQEKARKLEKVVSEAIADRGRNYVKSVFGLSDSAVSKFCSANHADDCKINVKSMSEFLTGLGLEICPPNHIPVHKTTIIWAWQTCRMSLGDAPILRKLRKQFEEFFGQSMDSFSNDD